MNPSEIMRQEVEEALATNGDTDKQPDKISTDELSMLKDAYQRRDPILAILQEIAQKANASVQQLHQYLEQKYHIQLNSRDQIDLNTGIIKRNVN